MEASPPEKNVVKVPGVSDEYAYWDDPIVALRDALRRDGPSVDRHHRAWADWMRRRGVSTKWLPRLPVDDSRFGSLTMVEPPYEFDAPIPTVYGDAGGHDPSSRLTIPCDGGRYWTTADATVVGGWDVVLTPEGACWPALTPAVESLLVSNALDLKLLGWTPAAMALKDDPRPSGAWQKLARRWQRIDRAIVLVGEHSFQYGHWLLDYLPRALAVRQLPVNVPVIVDADLPPNSLWWLRQVLPGRRIVMLPRGRVIDVGTLHVPLQRTFCPTGWIDPMELTPDVWSPDPAAIATIQRIVTVGQPSPARTRRIYLGRRGGNRPLVNQDLLLDRVASSGFETVYLETLSMPEVQRLFSETREVIAPAGAQLINVMAAQPGLRVLVMAGFELAQARAGNLLHPVVSGHAVAVVVGTREGPVGRNPYEDSQRPYAVNVDLLEMAIRDFFPRGAEAVRV